MGYREDYILAILLHHMIIRETIPLSQYFGSEFPSIKPLSSQARNDEHVLARESGLGVGSWVYGRKLTQS